jgi:hypothetical protein
MGHLYRYSFGDRYSTVQDPFCVWVPLWITCWMLRVYMWRDRAAIYILQMAMRAHPSSRHPVPLGRPMPNGHHAVLHRPELNSSSSPLCRLCPHALAEFFDDHTNFFFGIHLEVHTEWRRNNHDLATWGWPILWCSTWPCPRHRLLEGPCAWHRLLEG